MKKEIHPAYYKDVKVRCVTCNKEFILSTTVAELKVEICSNCHPAYTGKKTIVDTAGRVERFMAKQKKAVDLKEIAKEEKAKAKEEAKVEKKPAKKKKVAKKK